MNRKLVFSAVLVCVAIELVGQTSNGSIGGRVVDTTGAIILNAHIAITDLDRNISQARDTDASGNFLFPAVRIGTYSVTISAQGFRTFVQQPLKVDVNQNVNVDAILQVGEMSEKVVVEAVAPLLQTASGALGQVINSHEIVDLPLNGRNFLQLATLSGNVTQTSGGLMGNPALSVDGGRSQKTEFLLDGADNTETTYNGVRLVPSIDAIQEFRIESNSFSAEFGRSTATVNVAIKSGTNGFHGTAFEFLRNDKLDARNFFALQRPPYKQNQFGGSAGGPIRKDKLFFFADYEGTRIRQGLTANNNAATSAQRAGDYSNSNITIFDPFTIRPNPSGSAILKDQFPGNRIPGSRISPVATFFLPFIPLPNSGSQFIYSPSYKNNQNRGDARLDYNSQKKQSIFGRYSFQKVFSFSPGVTPLSGASTSNTLSQAATLGETYTISPNWLNEARLTWSRAALGTSPQGLGTNYTVQSGIKGFEQTSQTYPGFPNLGISSYLGVNGLNFSPILAFIGGVQFTDHVSYVSGHHALKVGFDLYRTTTPTLNNAYDRGSFSFNGGFSGNGFADYLLGYPSAVSRGFPRNMFGVRSTNYAFFLQDDWRITARLTLNLGLRYDMLPPQSWIRNVGASYDFLGLTKSPRTLALANDASGKIDLTSQQVTAYNYPFVKDIVVSARDAGIPDNLVYTNWKNFAPRLGLAWRPFGDKTAVRAGFGTFYMLTQGLRSIGSGPINAPLQVDESLIVSSSVAPPTTIVDIMPPFGQNFVQVGFSDLDPHQPTPYVLQWNFAVQHQVRPSLALEASYTGSSAHKLEYTQAMNVPLPGPGTIAARRPVPRFGPGAYLANIGYANLNSLKLRADQRLSHGLTFVSSYVYGKAIDSNTNEPSNGGVEQDPSNLRAERGRSSFDVTHKFVAGAVYDLPLGPGKPFLNHLGSVSNALLGGWRIGSIVTLRSGLPFTPSINGDPANTGRPQRPNRIASGQLDNPSINGWFDVSAFVVASAFTYGNSGRNILNQPSLRNWDFSVYKEVPVRETCRLQLRAEFFNFTNTPAFGAPTSQINSPTAGKIFSAGTPRDIQFGLKYVF